MLGIRVIFIELSRTIFIELSSNIFVFLTKYYLGNQTKEDEMGSEYGKYGGKQKCIWDSGQKPEGKRPFEDQGAKRVMLKCDTKKLCQSQLQKEKPT